MEGKEGGPVSLCEKISGNCEQETGSDIVAEKRMQHCKIWF